MNKKEMLQKIEQLNKEIAKIEEENESLRVDNELMRNVVINNLNKEKEKIQNEIDTFNSLFSMVDKDN
jgi:regulator of replication initiation timing